MKAGRRGLFAVHVAVLAFGLAGLFGKLSVAPIGIVFWRALFAAIALAIVLAVLGKKPWAIATKTKLILTAMGALLALHWIAFFHAIQISSVAVVLLSFSTFPLIAALLEPLLPNERFQPRAILCASIACAGVALLIPSFDLSTAPARGVLFGVASGVLFAIIVVLNRAYVAKVDALTLAFWQNGIAACVLVPFRPDTALAPGSFALLALLGIVFTGGAHALFIHGMREVSARVASLIGALEPVYGVVFAAYLLDEIPSLQTLLGGGIVVGAVVLGSTRPTKS